VQDLAEGYDSADGSSVNGLGPRATDALIFGHQIAINHATVQPSVGRHPKRNCFEPGNEGGQLPGWSLSANAIAHGLHRFRTNEGATVAERLES
jgi:hypothetical protein